VAWRQGIIKDHRLPTALHILLRLYSSTEQ
jgi:hypothetical protein